MNAHGPTLLASLDCEHILRSLPRWFGIEESLLEYVRDTSRFPTFLVEDSGQNIAFLTVREHFSESWEVHCLAVELTRRGQGIGRLLHNHVESWLRARGARLLQVKTLAESHPSPEYADTRQFYAAMGYIPHEVFPVLWGPKLPVLQLVKVLTPSAHAV